MSDNEKLISKAYAGFNSRNADAVLSLMQPNIHWPKAFEGGYVVGPEAVKDYWTRQWSEIDPVVEPIAVTERPDGKTEVEVKQLVKGLDGGVLFDGNVKHVYLIENGLIRQMDIE